MSGRAIYLLAVLVFTGSVNGLARLLDGPSKSRRNWPYPGWTDSPLTVGGKVLVYASDKRKLYDALGVVSVCVVGFLYLLALVAFALGLFL